VYVLDLAAPPVPIVVNSTGNLGDLVLGDGVCDTGGTVGLDPECTLRAAIGHANATAGDDVIEFNIPVGDLGHSGGVWTITPSGSALPSLATTITIDGTTQTGWAATPVIEIDGNLLAGTDGLVVTGDNVEIRSLAIGRFDLSGIHVAASASGTVIAGNHLGIDASGSVDRGNFHGIDLSSGSGPTMVGGPTDADRNVVSGNDDDGMVVWESSGNTILGNYFGTDATGNAPLPNDQDGVALGGTSSNNIIGQVGAGNVFSGNTRDGLELDNGLTGNVIQANIMGLGADGNTLVANGRHGLVLYDGVNNTQVGGDGIGEGNTISSNTVSGIVIDGNGGVTTTGNTIQGNYIGTDAGGTLDRGNGSRGIHLFNGATGNTIGGANPGEGNLISANGDYGIDITDGGTDSNTVAGNYIGTDVAGTADLGNATDGVAIRNSAQSNSVGGVTVGHRNIIAGNDNDGVWITGAGTQFNTVLGNWIGVASDGSALGNSYHGVAIEFGAADNLIGGTTAADSNRIENNVWDGVGISGPGTGNTVLRNTITANAGLGIDYANDGVTPNGAGDPLNYPVITSATETGGNVTVAFDLDVPAGNYRVEFFVNPSGADPSGNGEGEAFVDLLNIVSHPGGPASYGLVFPGSAGDVITATATEAIAAPFGSTSEFSAAVPVVPQPNSPPVANDDAVGAPEDGVVVINVKVNDTDAEDGTPGGPAAVVAQPLHGSAVANSGGTGTVTYTPNPDFYGTDQFTYTIDDLDGDTSNVATVVITVAGFPDAPTATDDGTYNVLEDGSLAVDAFEYTFDLEFGTSGSGAGQFVGQRGVAVGPDGSV
ncbi:MAG: cadherin-like domain-containing protein, partial [Acidimicrobiia bacterium]|nr:cadherin-like domain-containing protein [Acidimicrobiia bacterium]